MLIEKFKAFIQQHKLVPENGKIILAISGGIDSMVMMSLFSKLKINGIVAHCNFGLRNEESDGDEKFVNESAVKLGFPFISKHFETANYAESNNISIQMAARELRYNWFLHLCEVHNIESVAVAHNKDDVLETFFINLGRGTGIKGITGIKRQNDTIIRPLLFASRAEIEGYATDENITYREDSSNTSDKYQRNYIRHHILPSFENIFPKFRDSLTSNISKFNDAGQLYEFAIEHLIKNVFKRENDLGKIDINQLLSTPAPKTILFEILAEFNFTPPTIEEIYDNCSSIPGKQFYSPTHRLIKDRNCFIIERSEPVKQTRYYIEEPDTEIQHPLSLQLKLYPLTPNFAIKKDRSIAILDYEKIQFPLILRKWNQGDYFYPLGMDGIKKLSDFFIDQKFSLIDKDKTWILASGPDILWIIGHRIDNRYKVTAETKHVLEIEWIK